nr:ECF transporter S component [Anaerocolumna sedimenticola]
MNNKTFKIVVAALMAAMTCIATMIIKIPSPTSGYIHMGMVLYCYPVLSWDLSTVV